MPGKGLKKGHKKRLHKKSKHMKKEVVLINKVSKGGFPDTYETKMVWNGSALVLGSNTTPGYTRVFYMNDPTFNNVIVPQGWSILKQVYDGYIVHFVKVKLTFNNTSTTVPVKVFVSGIDQDTANISIAASNAITSAEANSICMSPYAKTKNMSVMGGGKDIVTLTWTMPIAKFAGIKKITTESGTRYGGNTGFAGNSTQAFTQPAYLPRIVYGAVTVTGANIATNQVYVDQELTYYTQFLEKLGVYD